MKKLLELLRENTLTQIAVISFIMLGSALFAEHSDVAHLIMTLSCGLLAVYVLRFIVMGFINLIEKKDKKK